MNEEGSIIRVFPEALPCSNTDEQGRRNETSDGDPGGGGDLDGAGSGVLASSGRAFTFGASLVLHRWLANDKKGKNPKASKREECEMIISIRWRVHL
jgi:hypothetical protein